MITSAILAHSGQRVPADEVHFIDIISNLVDYVVCHVVEIDGFPLKPALGPHLRVVIFGFERKTNDMQPECEEDGNGEQSAGKQQTWDGLGR